MANTLPIDIYKAGMPTIPQSYADIRKFLEDRLKTASNWDQIDKVLNETGVLDIILHLLASSYEINNFLNIRSDQESTLSFATLPESIIEKARELGYRINRYAAPVVKLRYNGIPTLEVSTGFIFGQIKDYELIYFGDTKLIEKGDYVLARIGKYVEQTLAFNNEQKITVELQPQFLTSIDNYDVDLYLDGVKKDKSLFPEDYIVQKKWSDFSSSKVGAFLRIADLDLMQGLAEDLSSTATRDIVLKYIETDGELNFSVGINDIVSNEFELSAVMSNGTLPDSDKKIISDAPIMYSLMRRACTEDDFKFLLRNQPTIRDASIVPYGGARGKFKITVNQLELAAYSVIINNVVYSTERSSSQMTASDVLYMLYDQLKSDDIVTPNLEFDPENPTQAVSIILSAVSSRVFLALDVSANLNNDIVTQQVNPVCCVLQVNYVRSNTVDGPLPLSLFEYSRIANVVDKYKQIGITLFYKMLEKQDVELTLRVTNSEVDTRDKITESINQVVAEFDKRTEILIDSVNIVGRIDNLIRFKYGNNIRPNISASKFVSEHIDEYHYSNIKLLVLFS